MFGLKEVIIQALEREDAVPRGSIEVDAESSNYPSGISSERCFQGSPALTQSAGFGTGESVIQGAEAARPSTGFPSQQGHGATECDNQAAEKTVGTPLWVAEAERLS